jgi:predicted methyltransferase
VPRSSGHARRALAAGLAAALPLLARAETAAERDRWQRPGAVMDALGVARGSAVADVGAGDGYFTLHLARRVGPEGRVVAVDLLETELAGIRRAARAGGLPQVETVRGEADDPRLPEAALDAVLVVNSYHEMGQGAAMMRGFYRALRPGGRLGIVDKVAEPGEPEAGYRARHAIPSTVVRADAEAAGFRFVVAPQGFVRPRRGGEPWYFLVFERPTSGTSAPPS